MVFGSKGNSTISLVLPEYLTKFISHGLAFLRFESPRTLYELFLPQLPRERGQVADEGRKEEGKREKLSRKWGFSRQQAERRKLPTCAGVRCGGVTERGQWEQLISFLPQPATAALPPTVASPCHTQTLPHSFGLGHNAPPES